MKYLIEFLKWYEGYCFDCDVDDLTHLGLVYSTFDTDDGEEHEIEMTINLVTLTETIKSDEITLTTQYDSYEELFRVAD